MSLAPATAGGGSGTLVGASSWFGGPNDPSAQDPPASGISIDTPGIAVYNRATLGGWWALKAPNGNIGFVRQTDIGPAPRTKRLFDYTYSLLPLFGYTQQNFPTGGQSQAVFLGSDSEFRSGQLGTKISTALATLGATPTQSATLMQSLDVGLFALKGGAAVVAAPNAKPGQTNTAMGQSVSGSSAVSAGIDLPVDLPGSGVLDFFRKLFSAENIIRLLEVIGGVILVAMGLRALTGSGPSPVVTAARQTAAKAAVI